MSLLEVVVGGYVGHAFGCRVVATRALVFVLDVKTDTNIMKCPECGGRAEAECIEIGRRS